MIQKAECGRDGMVTLDEMNMTKVVLEGNDGWAGKKA